MITYFELFTTANEPLDLIELIGKAHANGTLPRQHLTQIAVACCKTVLDKISPMAQTALLEIEKIYTEPSAVNTDIDDVKKTLFELTYSSAYKAHVGNDSVVTYASLVASHSSSNNTAAHALAYVVHASTLAHGKKEQSYSILCDVIRDEITVEEICRALNVKPDEVMS